MIFEGLRAYYDPEPNCSMCLDRGWVDDTGYTCSDCKKTLREEVLVLQLGVGMFANKAIIKKSNGKLDTVSMSTITLL